MSFFFFFFFLFVCDLRSQGFPEKASERPSGGVYMDRPRLFFLTIFSGLIFS